MRKNSAWKRVLDYSAITSAALIYALGLYAFTVPANIAPGGVSGLFTAINYISGFPIGLGMLLVNIPLLIAGFFVIGKEFIVKTAIATVISSVAMDGIFPLFMPVYHGDKFLSALFGGVLIGVGIGLLYSRGGSSGGTDIVCRIIKRKFPFIRIGRISMYVDFVIVAFSTYVFKNIESALYAVVALFVTSFMIDRIVNGMSEGCFAFIITKMNEEVSRGILEECGRGCTVMEALGAYSSEKRGVIICALRDNERYKLTDTVKEIDPDAFIVVTRASEVLGNGFERGLR